MSRPTFDDSHRQPILRIQPSQNRKGMVLQVKTHIAQRTVDFKVNPAEEIIGLGLLAVHFLITGENSGGSIATFELIVPGAQRLAAPAHSHDHYEETIYGIDGVLTWTVDGKQIEVGPGQALCICRGAVHGFANDGRQEVKALCVITPAGIGQQYFRQSAEVMKAAAGGPPGPREAGRDHARLRPYPGSCFASGLEPGHDRG